MKKEISRCMGCMNEKLYSGPCEICGYIDNDAYPSDCLAPRTLLADRYVLGKLISKGGEGALYLAFDTELEKAVEIKEFMPDTLCKRGEDHESVEVIDGALPLFKSYLSEYADLHKSIMTDINNDHLKKSYNIFAANGTGYVVTEHINGVTLAEYLANNENIMSWGELSRLFRPLFRTLSDMHAKGIIHRGLSPETIMIRESGSPVITATEISAARTADSRLTSEMFAGYAASEQYDLSERQGSWTDVYGISAVIYRALTGITPPDAVSRKTSDTLVPAHEVNEDVPAYVSDALSAGMSVSGSERIHDAAALCARLYDAPEEPDEPDRGASEDDGPITPNVHVKFDIEEQEEHRQKAAKNKKKKKEARRNIGTAIGLIIFLALVTALVICIIYFSKEAQNINDKPVSTQTTTTTAAETDRPKPEKTTTPAETVPAVTTEITAEKLLMPNLVNRFYNSSLRGRYSILEFETTEEYSDTFAEGIIMEQDIPEGTTVTEGTVVHLKVSKGAAYVLLPDYIGMKLSDYTNKLTELGISYETVSEETTEVKKGYVVRCSKEIDDKVMISENEVVTVYYAIKPTVTTTTEEEVEIPIDSPDDENEETVSV